MTSAKTDKAKSGGCVKSAKSFIKLSCTVGIFCAVVFAAAFVGLLIYMKSASFGSGSQFDGLSFTEKLDTFDNLFKDLQESGTLPNPETWTALLDSLEKSAVGTEGELSVLKRRRLIARSFPFFLPSYYFAAERAAQKFPHSAAVCALAGEALFLYENENPNAAGGEADSTSDGAVKESAKKKKDGALTPREKYLRYAKVLSESGPLSEKSFLPLAFSFYALSGELGSLKKAQGIPHIEDVFAFTVYKMLGEGAGRDAAVFETVAIDAALLKILSQNGKEALSFLTPVDKFNASSVRASEFFANFSYDFGDVLSAAEIWMKRGGEKDFARAADAFYIAGKIANARQLWLILSAEADGGGENKKLSLQSLYNLAGTARDNGEKKAALERLLAETGASLLSGERFEAGVRDCLIYGTVMYTRLLPDERAVSLLRDNPMTANTVLLDLELTRRLMPSTPYNKSVADVWLLVDRHPEEVVVYEWASWYFNFQKSFSDTDFLLKKAERASLSGAWIPFNYALSKIRAGDYEAALPVFQDSIKRFNENADSGMDGGLLWAFYANEALVLEAEHNFREALSLFLAAKDFLIKNAGLERQGNKLSAALLDLRLVRIFRVLGMEAEADAALDEAGKLAGDNINVRLVLNRRGANDNR